MIFRDGRAVDAVQRADGGGSGDFRRGARLGGLVGAADDQRQSVGVRVVVTVAHQPGHIEQLLAQQPEDTYDRATVGNTYVLARQTFAGRDGRPATPGGQGRAPSTVA
ncbi:hypothetical protein [Streptomyces sp. NRRL WC-3725]|uniref:hypothetical protein n=1 Tax=Streptomyces sp. NRRL WC-3725 TaxID=1463933 RepID=UPI001F2DF85C|nr:hypothetical protein [Streptomyces sp. NRRL WC-3725]